MKKKARKIKKRPVAFITSSRSGRSSFVSAANQKTSHLLVFGLRVGAWWRQLEGNSRTSPALTFLWVVGKQLKKTRNTNSN